MMLIFVGGVGLEGHHHFEVYVHETNYLQIILVLVFLYII